jgi:hypothetical protein
VEYAVFDGRATGIRIGREVSRCCHACRREFGENLLLHGSERRIGCHRAIVAIKAPPDNLVIEQFESR